MADLQQQQTISPSNTRRSFGRHYPAMTLVIVAGLLEERARVEIEATAVLPT